LKNQKEKVLRLEDFLETLREGRNKLAAQMHAESENPDPGLKELAMERERLVRRLYETEAKLEAEASLLKTLTLLNEI
jgi:hypothetical protein